MHHAHTDVHTHTNTHAHKNAHVPQDSILARVTYVCHRTVRTPATRFFRRATEFTWFISNLQETRIQTWPRSHQLQISVCKHTHTHTHTVCVCVCVCTYAVLVRSHDTRQKTKITKKWHPCIHVRIFGTCNNCRRCNI